MQKPDKKDLKSKLLNIAGHKIYRRGVDYYNSGYVESIKALPGNFMKSIEITGRVEGTRTRPYKAELFFDLEKNTFSRLDCSCPYWDDCKHSVALGLEFIDRYFDFRRTMEKQPNVYVLKDNLIDWINKPPKGKPDKNQNKKDARGPSEEFSRDDPDEYADDYHDESYEYKDDEEQRTQDELLDELADAVSIGDAPSGVIEDLIKQIDLSKKEILKAIDKRLKKIYQFDDFTIGSNKKQTSFLPDFEKAERKFNALNYCIVLELNQDFNAEVHRDAPYPTHPEPLDIFFEKYKKGFTGPQKKLFKHLMDTNFWRGDNRVDYEKLFTLLGESGMKLYQAINRSRIILNFNHRPAKKIKAELLQRKNDNKWNNELPYSFIFKIDNKFSNQKAHKLLCGRRNIIEITGNEINIHKMPAILMKIISRVKFAKSAYYWRDEEDACQTKLTVKEIIKLNQIITAGQKYFDFSSVLNPDYNIKKFDQARPCLLVDYDSKKDKLEVIAAVDYGFIEQDVAESVSRYCQNYQDKFNRLIPGGNDNKYIIKIEGKNISYALIKKTMEIDLYKFFCYKGKEYGFNRQAVCAREREKDIFKFLNKNWPAILKLCENKGYEIKHIRDRLDLINGDFRVDFNVDFKAASDWLAFDVNCYCGRDKLNLEDLKNYIKDKKGFIKLSGSRLLKISNSEELERFILMLESFYAKENDRFEGRLYHAPELDYVFTSSKYYNAKMAAGFSRFVKEVKKGKPVKKIKLSAEYGKVLRSYQKEGIDWFYFLRKYRFAGILADDMGTGKTLQSLVLMSKNKVKNKPSIVVCPKTLIYNWLDEVEKFTPDIKTLAVDGLPSERREKINRAKKFNLIITSYSMMQKDCEEYEKKKIKFNYCILDEAQFIKNYKTKNAQIVKKIDAGFRLALTGTPLENSVSEIWSIFDFLMPGFLGSNKNFIKRFEKPIMVKSNSQALTDLRKKIECFMLRRLKSDVLKELPPKIEQVSHCRLEPAQNILYQEILANVKSEIFATVKEKGFARSQIHILAGLTKLRQICNHPALLLKDKDYTKYESAKLNIFNELVGEIVLANRKVLVFSQFTKMLDILAKELDKNNIEYSYLSGQTKNRQGLIKDFNENMVKQVFLISLRAGGTGLNLTAADNVIIFDPWWNPSVEVQAVDRAHRIGQKNAVNVYRLITQGTIEDRIVKLQEKKKYLFDNIVGESRDLFKKLTWNDIRGLFK